MAKDTFLFKQHTIYKLYIFVYHYHLFSIQMMTGNLSVSNPTTGYVCRDDERRYDHFSGNLSTIISLNWLNTFRIYFRQNSSIVHCKKASLTEYSAGYTNMKRD